MRSPALADVRARIVDALLRTGVVVGVVAWVPSMIASVTSGLWALAVLDTAVYVWLLAIRFLPLQAKTRALHLTLLIGTIGLGMLLALGPFGYGIMWLLGATVAAGMLLGAHAGRRALLTQLAAIAVVTVVTAIDPMLWALREGTMGAWLAFAGGSLFLGATLSESLARLLEGIEEAHAGAVADAAVRVRLEQQLLRAQQLEAVGTLAGGLAHDFNNLLQPIVALAEVVRSDLGPDHPAGEDLDGVIRAADRARLLVRQMSQMARLSTAEAPVRLPLHLGAMIGAFVPLVRASIRAQVELAIECDVEPSADDVILADEQELQRMILNLVKNAAQAMPEAGGRIVLRLTSSDDPEGQTDAEDNGLGFVVLEVIDDGAGIDAATLARIFEPYFTTKPVGEGTGLGLALVQGITHSMGGAVTVQSTLGEGTCFRLTFPRAARMDAAPPARRARRLAAHAHA